MRRFLSFACLLSTFALKRASEAQTSGTALCDGIAAQVRDSREITSGQVDPFSVLSKGDHPFIELASQSEMKFVGQGDASDKAEFVNTFVTASR